MNQDLTQRSRTVNVAPDSDLNRYEQLHNPHGYGAPAGGMPGGNSEELAQTLEKIVSQLDIISRTLHVIE